MKKTKLLILPLFLFIVCLVCLCGCQHSHSHTPNVVNPTTTSLGYTEYSCSCGDFYRQDYTCLLSFTSITENNNIQSNLLPVIQSQIVALNENFIGVNNTNSFRAVEYRVYSNNSYTNLYIGQNISTSLNITIVWEQITTLTETEIAFNDLLAKIKKLEQISEQYNIEKNIANIDPNLRAMHYIRYTRYNTTQWNMLAGTLESDFVDYVEQNMGQYDLASLQSMSNFIVPKTNEEIDFVHMIAVMNVACNAGVKNHNYNDLPGWLGDLCQLAGQIKKLELAESDIYTKAQELFAATTNSSFSIYDLIADLDAINIMQIYENLEEKSISSIMEQYYNAVKMRNRKDSFIITALDGETNVQTLKSNIRSRITDSTLMAVWCYTEGLNLTASYDNIIIDSLIDLFINYILN
ncbi:MAG: hypothetical protein E7376_02810 [Clostridiales bacterium]|nr:hypothetical protein [Clostridiales bacterium]